MTMWNAKPHIAPCVDTAYLFGQLDEVGSVASCSRFEPCVRDKDNQEEFEEGTRGIILMTALDVSPEDCASR